MHDVVREHCIQSVPPAERRLHHRGLVGLLQNAMPADGWTAQHGGALAIYVQRSCRHHMTESIDGPGDIDDEVLRWLEVESLSPTRSFWLRSAANAIGADYLIARGERIAEAGGSAWVAGLSLLLAAMTDAFVAKSQYRADGQGGKAVTLELMQRAAALLAAEADTARRRTAELTVLADLGGLLPMGKAGPVARRQAQLVDLGVAEPTAFEERLRYTIALGNPAMHLLGFVPMSAGNHLDLASIRAHVRIAILACQARTELMDEFSVDDPKRIGVGVALDVGGWASDGHWYVPSDDESQFDPGEQYTAEWLDGFYNGYRFELHHSIAVAEHPFSSDFIAFGGPTVLAIRHGELAAIRSFLVRFLTLYGKPGALEFDAEGNVANFSAYTMYYHGGFAVNPALLVAGLTDVWMRWAKLMRVDSFSGIDGWFVNTYNAPLIKHLGWSVTEPIAVTCFAEDLIRDRCKLKLFYSGPQSVSDTEIAELLSAAPGELGTARDGSFDVWDGNMCNNGPGALMEAEARERAGQFEKAIEAGTIYSARFPYNQLRQTMGQMVIMRCHAALARVGVAQAIFDAGVHDADNRRIYLLEALMVRDYIVAVCGGEGAAAAQPREAVLPLLGLRGNPGYGRSGDPSPVGVPSEFYATVTNCCETPVVLYCELPPNRPRH